MNLYQAIVAILIAVVCAGTLAWFIRRAPARLADLFARGWVARQFPRNLRRYLDHLASRTLTISHPWMREGQTLADILVPITLFVDHRRTDSRVFLGGQFREDNTPRIVVTGPPGSGKSIALADAARFLSTLERAQPLIPVLFTFSDIKGATTKEDLETVIADKLRHDQFTDGKPDQESTSHFIQAHLYEGNIALLIDGYDELDREQRLASARFICEFLVTYRKIPAILASRSAVYERETAFRSVATNQGSMAPLSPLAINRFASQWRFDDGKSSSELLSHINGKAHLSELASNPLMLTIICFLYAQPKYILPDNRVEFYRECSRALLEKWDLARAAARANHFESDHKIDVLSRIAYAHISKGEITDEEINSTDARDVTRQALEALSLKSSDDGRALQEIVENSGLLVELPPSSYRFPHRTFIEFFAAVYLYEQTSVEQLIELYSEDEARWRPTLLMYAGLCRNRDKAERLLADLRRRFADSIRGSNGPDITVFSALIETSFAAPWNVEVLLSDASDYLHRQPLNSALIEELGFIAANTKWTYSATARTILINLLKRELPGALMQVVVLAAMRCRNAPDMTPFIVNRLGELNLVEVFIQAGDQASYYLSRLLAVGLSPEGRQQLTDGLLAGGHLGLLADIMVESSDQDLADRAGHALFAASGAAGFTAFLDGHEAKPFNRDLAAHVATALKVRGWPLQYPRSEAGRALAIAIACHAARSIAADGGELGSGNAAWLAFLVRLELRGMGPDAAARAVQGDAPGTLVAQTPGRVLERIWRKSAQKEGWWNHVLRIAGENDYMSGPLLILSILCITVALIGIALRLAKDLAYPNLPGWVLVIPLSDSISIAGLGAVATLVVLLATKWNYNSFLAPLLPATLIAMNLASIIKAQNGGHVVRLPTATHQNSLVPPISWYAATFLSVWAGLYLVGGVLLCSFGLYCVAAMLIINAIALCIFAEDRFLVYRPIAGGERNFDVSQSILSSNEDPSGHAADVGARATRSRDHPVLSPVD